MRAFGFAGQARGSGTDLDVSDAHVEQVPMKRRAEFLASANSRSLRQLGGGDVQLSCCLPSSAALS